MNTKTPANNDYRQAQRPVAIELVMLAALCALVSSSAKAQIAAPGSGPTTINANVDAVRPLARVLDRVQHLFLSPIAFEEAPFATNPELGSPAAAVSGDPTPVLSVTLGATDTTPYYAAGTALYAYKNAGLPGVYKAVQNNGWVSVVPVQVLGADGSMRDVIPVMSSPVTFPVAERDAIATLQMIADAAGKQAGAKILVLNVPFWEREKITLGATGQPAGEVIVESIGKMINRPVSFQCLYDVRSKTYYLNVTIVAADPPPGTTVPPNVPKLGPHSGPANSPWFRQTQ
jgi:hypothetical protein